MKDLEDTYGTEFRFQNPESAEMQGLVERLHKTISYSMLALKQANLQLSQIATIVKGLQCMLNKRPLGDMTKENTDEIEFVTPNMLLTGFDINVCPSYSVPKVTKNFVQSREDIIRYSRHMKAIHTRAWGKFILTYVENLNVFKKKFKKQRKVQIGDYVLYSGLNKEMCPVNTYQVCKIKEIISGRHKEDNEPRSLKVELIKGGKSKIFTRSIRRFALLELDDLKTPDNETPGETITRLNKPINHKQNT